MAVTLVRPNTNGRIIFFTFTHTEGEAVESFTVMGAVLGAFAWIDGTGAQPVIVKCTTSLDSSTGKNTVSIQCSQTVTEGKGFVISSSY